MGMSAIIGALRVVFGADTAAFEHGSTKARREMAKTERNFQRSARKIKNIGKSMSVAMTLPLAAIGLASFKTAADVGELESAFDATFTGTSAKMRKWSEETGDLLGRSTQEIQESAVAFASLFNKAFDPDQANEMTKTFAVLTQDLASFKNLSNETAQQKLFSGLTGEAEPLKSVGVFINETSTKAKLLELGIKKVNGAWTDQQKIVARAALIQEQLVVAQGDVIRTSDGTVNQLKESKAAWQELQVVIGTKLLPVLTPLITKGTELLTSIANLDPAIIGVATAGGALLAVLGPITTGIGGVLSVLSPMLAGVSWLTTAVGTGAGVGLVGSLTLLLGPLALVAAGFVLLDTVIVTAKEAAKSAAQEVEKTRGLMSKYSTTQGQLEKDTVTLKLKTDELNKAIKSSGTEAVDAARLEVDAIRRRIAKNKELRLIYLDDIKLQLRRAKAATEEANLRGVSSLAPTFTNKSGLFNKTSRIKEDEEYRAALIAGYKVERDQYRAMVDEGELLSIKEQKRFEKINAFFADRAERAEEILELEKQISGLTSKEKPKPKTKPDPKTAPTPDASQTPTEKQIKAAEKRAQKSRDAATGAREEARATIELAEALAKSQREYDIQVASQDLVRDGYMGTTAQIREMAVAIVDANGKLDAAQEAVRAKADADKAAAVEAQKLIDAQKERNTQSARTVEAITQEVIENAQLAAAMQVSRREYELVSARLDIMRSGFQGTKAEAAALAEKLVNSRGALDTARTGMTDAEKAAEKLKKKLDATGTSGVKAFQGISSSFSQLANGLKSGDILDVLGGILGMLDKIAGLSGGFKIAGLNFGGARASGGGTEAGKTYLVGEKGPELWTANGSGFVTPNHKLAEGPGASGGGSANVKVIPSPLFDVVVDERARNQAQPIAVATTTEGMGQAQRQSAYQSTRALT